MKRVFSWVGGIFLFILAMAGVSVFNQIMYTFWLSVIDIISYAWEKLAVYIVLFLSFSIIVSIVNFIKWLVTRNKTSDE
jgi:hypothetical protein